MTSGRRVLWWLGGLALLVLMLSMLRGVLLPFVVGAGMAYFLNPLADRLEGWGMPRAAASLTIVALMSVLVTLLLVLIVPMLVSELRDLAANMPKYLQDLRKWLEEMSRRMLGRELPGLHERLEKGIGEVSANWASAASAVLLGLLSGGRAVVSLLSVVLITPVVAFYMLADWPRMLEKIDSWLPRDQVDTVRHLADEINKVLAGFVRGQGTVCLILATIYGVGLSWAGIKSGLLIGILTGLMSFVPFVGFAVGAVIACIVAVAQYWPDWVPLAKVLAVFAAGQALEAGFLSPKIVAGHIKLHPVWLIFALFAFGYLFGLVGMLVAVPTAAAIGVLARFGVEEYLKSPLYSGAKPTGSGSDGSMGSSERDLAS
jgi:predicted PurR-regulated permease PerM